MRATDSLDSLLADARKVSLDKSLSKAQKYAEIKRFRLSEKSECNYFFENEFMFRKHCQDQQAVANTVFSHLSRTYDLGVKNFLRAPRTTYFLVFRCKKDFLDVRLSVMN